MCSRLHFPRCHAWQLLSQRTRHRFLFGMNCLLAGLLWFSCSAFALSDQALFQHARESYNAKNETALGQDLAELKKQEYILAPYADYWLMLLRLDKADHDEVENFLSQYGDYPFAERLRGEWLKILGKQQDWQTFLNIIHITSARTPQCNVTPCMAKALLKVWVLSWSQVPERYG